jgi:glutaredoxin-related protein
LDRQKAYNEVAKKQKMKGIPSLESNDSSFVCIEVGA